MHAYYASKMLKFRAGMNKFLSLVASELEKASGKEYAALSEEIWAYYEKNLLERFPYIGGNKVSGTKNSDLNAMNASTRKLSASVV